MALYRMVFDTETTGLDKPFCYDLGYTIINMENGETVKSAHYVIEQIWHNLPLFESAYYHEKRPLYVALMRARKAQMVKWGQATQAMVRDIKAYEITDVYAYNSTFDDKVFTFNCDWYKTINPLDNVAVHDIWGYASQFITNSPEYQAFCEAHELFTKTGNYSGSAETVWKFITQNPEFEEKHMGYYDSDIESGILLYCLINEGAELDKDYKVVNILKRPIEKPFVIKINNAVVYTGMYVTKSNRNDVYSFRTNERG